MALKWPEKASGTPEDPHAAEHNKSVINALGIENVKLKTKGG